MITHNLRFRNLISVVILVTLLNSCKLDLLPYSALTSDGLSQSEDGTRGMANGCVMMMKEQLTNDPRNMYVRHLYQLTEFPSDNVLIVKSTTDNLWYSFNRQHIPDQLNTSYLWYTGYKIVMETNNIIGKVEVNENTSAELKQYLGEAYFYRALVFFDLARLFSFPPALGKQNPGIILRTSIDEPDLKARASVEQTYNQIISDLKKGADLMTTRNAADLSESKKYGNKWADLALLTRAFLFTEQYDSVIYYADKVISESPFTLATHDNYLSSMWNTPSSSEAMFIVYYSSDEDKVDASIGSMYNGDSKGKGWGEVYPSQPYQALVTKYPNDIRNQFIDTVFSGPNIAIYPGTTFKKFYINKFSYQEANRPTLWSPVLIRLSEVYLNRAEAYAHLSQDNLALDDVNTIRARAGLSNDELITTANLTSTHGYTTVLQAVLDERRLELAFEGQRRDDLMRNKIDLNRSYPSAQNINGDPDIYPYNGNRQIYFIPLTETLYNSACSQNDN